MIKRIRQFIEDVQVEMAKVSWPPRHELVNSTFIVVIVSIVFTLYIFFADMIIANVVKIFY